MLWDLLALFFPNYCLTCPEPLVRGETLLCTSCFYDLPQTTYHEEPNNVVAQRLHGRLPIISAMALYKFRKASKVQQLIYALKYKNQPIIGQLLGKRYGTLLREARPAPTFNLVIPVPLHNSRLRQRGYNQSDFFAQGLAEGLGIPWSNELLKRVKATATQTKKSKSARIKNVQNAFCATFTTELHEQHVLLVDDVITTGATLEACGMAILAAGGKRISVATLAVTE